jgi:hypothetical protein
MARTGLRLFGVTANDHHGHFKPADGAQLVAFRDLTAVVEPADYVALAVNGQAIEDYRRMVEQIFTHAPVLPAPPGTVFRSRETLVRWLELHYVALSEALSFVEDRSRSVARVHAQRAGGRPDERETGSDLAAAAAEAFRALRRQAVASVPLQTEHLTGIVLSSAFLVDKTVWGDFVSAVDEQRANNPELVFELTGPWPPFDFVRMQFGS